MDSSSYILPELQLESSMVLLRPLRPSDYEHLLPFALNEPEIWQYSLVSGAGETGLTNYIQFAVDNYDNGMEIPFVVFNKQLNAYAGSTRFYDIQFSQRSLQLGYTWYGKAHRGSGINTHCKFLLLQYAFEKLQMERVEFRADAENTRSIRAMKKIGCVEEGILRSNTYKLDGRRRNSIVLSILKGEWESNVKGLLQERMAEKL